MTSSLQLSPLCDLSSPAYRPYRVNELTSASSQVWLPPPVGTDSPEMQKVFGMLLQMCWRYTGAAVATM